MTRLEFNIPSVRGTQAGHAFYTAMCPVRLLPRLFPVGVDRRFSEVPQSLPKVNRARVRAIAEDILAHKRDFHLAAVTVSVEQQVRFVAAGNARSQQIAAGELFVPLDARLTIVDGIHRICGLQLALKKCPDLADECIAMLILVDPDGSRHSQIFSDIKRHERPTAKSRRIAVDQRDDVARLTRDVIADVPVFRNAIEMAKTAISNRSRKLFTLSALYQANRALLADRKLDPYKQQLKLATEFWKAVSAQIPGWAEVVRGETSPADIRAGYVHCHGIGLSAIARAGRSLLAQSPDGWKKRLTRLATLDWSRDNTELWEGRAMIGGRLSKSNSAVALAGIAVKRHLGLKLSRDEKAMEN